MYSVEMKSKDCGWIQIQTFRSQDGAKEIARNRCEQFGLSVRVVVYRPTFKVIDFYYIDDLGRVI